MNALRRLGVALLLVALAMNAEGDRVLVAAGAEIAGDWDAYTVSRGAPALAIGGMAMMVGVVVAFSTFASLLDSRRGRVAWAASMAGIALPFALELSTGRKAQVPVFRVPFVLAMMLAFAALAGVVAPRLRGRRGLVLPSGVALVIASVLVDHRVLPRLYPIFHHALVATAAIGVVLVAEGLVELVQPRRHGPRAIDVAALAGLFLFASAVRRIPQAGRDLARYDNARRICDERSDLLSRAVALASKRWPPPPLDEVPDTPDPLAQTSARALDATGRDLLVVTIDALRADHVGAYGYARKTTPGIDALAAEGTLFTHAYTPTPHTSYAVASLMTGKYMRPVLALEAASGGGRRPDETWAGLLRTYGFRTAAMYPPAIWAVDGARFSALVERKLDFEYQKEEFAAPDLRAKQVEDWLATVPPGKPLFLWVHLFEPHEPYVAHPEFPFGDGELDRYDSEIASADAGLARIVKAFRARRPGAVVIVSADHGEAFGEHGARYHGTTVYEEQVRVPLIVSAPGLVAHRVVDRPVQLVDLMPTVLSAYSVPKPPRVRGLDLGPLLAASPPPAGEGIAFSEVEDMAMLARGPLRLICNRRTSTCPLYDLGKDPLELAALPTDDRLRKEMAAIVAGSARLEGFAGTDAATWPEALRRGFSGDREAAEDVAGLLDDVDVAFRRRAAEVLARLAHPRSEPAIKRALGKETDELTLRWLAIARVRTALDKPASPSELAALGPLLAQDKLAPWAALASGEALVRGVPSSAPSARAFEVLVAWFPVARSDADLGRAILAVLPALGKGAPSKASKVLKEALGDVRLRVDAADALGKLGDPEVAKDLDAMLALERHVDARAPFAVALARVGRPEKALSHLARFLGVPEPPPGAADALSVVAPLAERAPWLALVSPRAPKAKVKLQAPKGAAHRIVIGGPQKGTKVHVRVGTSDFEASVAEAGAVIEIGAQAGEVTLDVSSEQGALAVVAIVARVHDLPPPKPDRTLEEELHGTP